MPNPLSKPGFGDAQLADRVLKAYAESGRAVLSSEECSDLGIDAQKCGALIGVLVWDDAGEISKRDRTNLISAGFSEEFIDRFAGPDGKALVRKRVEWLANGIRPNRFWETEAHCAARSKMIDSIGELGPEGKNAVSALAADLRRTIGKKDGCTLRWTISSALVKIGPDAAGAVTSLIESYAPFANNDFTNVYKSSISSAIGSIGIYALPFLVDMMFDKDKKVSDAATDLFCELGNSLFWWGHEKDPELHKYFFPSLIRAMESKNENAHSTIRMILLSAGEVPQRLLDMLRNDMEKDPYLTYFILPLLIRSSTSKGLVEISELLDHSNSIIRMETAIHLGNSFDRQLARYFIPSLERMSNFDPSPECRQEAKTSLKTISAQIL